MLFSQPVRAGKNLAISPYPFQRSSSLGRDESFYDYLLRRSHEWERGLCDGMADVAKSMGHLGHL
jgi:hypothetical protein